MGGDGLRWFGTTAIAGAFGLIAIVGTIWLALLGKPIPDVLTSLDLAGATAFFAVFGSMVGARASQNGAQAATGQPLSSNIH